jgi:replicative DNA helicase
MKKLEENLLGTILLFPQEFVLSADKLKVEYFYHFETKCVYNAMCELLKGGFNIDTVTVCLELKKRGQLDQIGGPYYITSLTNEIGNLNFLINRLVEVYLIRELSFLGLQIQKKTADTVNDPLEIIEDINNKISDITTFKLDKVKTLKTIYGDLVKDIYEVINSGQPTGILSGLNDLDSITGGWQNGNLIIIAARPAMGKTAVALHLAKIPALNNIPVAFFSLEMTASELAGRLASSESYIPSTLINQKRIGLNDIEVMNTSFNKLSDAPFYIDDSSVLSISDLKAKAKKLKYERNIKLIIVDY